MLSRTTKEKRLKVKAEEVVKVVKKFIVDREDQRRDDPAMQLQAATIIRSIAQRQQRRRRNANFVQSRECCSAENISRVEST